jgi:serine/threonine-protein kinase
MAGDTRCPSCGAERPVDPLLGQLVGNRYEICELLGVGGMGRVYRAVHVGLDRMVALKVIHPRQLANRAAVKRFMLEARAVSRLSHPNVVAIHDFGGGSAAEGEALYLVMELLDGPSLGEVLRGGALTIPRTVDILCQILGALQEAHHQGITHRDIKPENILLTPDRSGADQVKVIDFGVAKLQAGSSVTRPGEVVGTPRYMAPEQARGAPAGPAADLYAVGVLMFQMLTGQRAFNGRVAYEVIAQILSAPRPDPCAVAPERGIPGPLAEACMRAMAIAPDERFPTAEAFARAVVAGAAEVWSPARAALFVPSALASERASRRTPPAASTLAERRAPDAVLTPASTPTPAPLSMPRLGPPSTEHVRPTVRIARVAPVSAPGGGSAPAPTPARPVAGEADLARRARDDHEGAVRLLAEGFQAARALFLAGELDAAAWSARGRRFAALLDDAGRVDEAAGVLAEVLAHVDRRQLEHALLAEQLAHVADRRGRAEEALALLRRALEVAELLGDAAVAARLRHAVGTGTSGVRRSTNGPPSPKPQRKIGGDRDPR